MPDHAPPEQPRIAFVFGDTGSAAHVREAMDGHAEIAYDTLQGEFDASRLQDSRVAAVLVNVGGGDWLGKLEDTLHAAGMPMIFNDPDISQGLDGWDRARWRRHLLAKICGSTDVDPPRPAAPALDEAASGGESAEPPGNAADFAAEVALVEGAAVERPLSSHEIETMTANFFAAPVAAQADADIAQSQPSMAVDDPKQPESPVEPVDEAVGDTANVAAAGLDVDTESLSAMIDARLAEPARAAADPDEVWRIADDGAAPTSQVDGDASMPETGAPADAEAVAGAAGATAGQADPDFQQAGVAPVEDADVLAGLPSLDDWELVDTNPMPASATRKQPPADAEPELPAGLAGIELVPMEPVVPQTIHTEPIERWLHGESVPKRGTVHKKVDEDQA